MRGNGIHARVLACAAMLCLSLCAAGGCARHRRPLVVPRHEPPAHVTDTGNVPSGRPVHHPGVRFSSHYGEARAGGRTHNGLDMVAPRGAPVTATATGTVVFAGQQRGYGNLVILCHGNGYETAYAHLDSIRAATGQQVRRGDVVGTVGDTGNATTPHVHYEVRKNGTPVNPMPYVQ